LGLNNLTTKPFQVSVQNDSGVALWELRINEVAEEVHNLLLLFRSLACRARGDIHVHS